MYKQKYLKYKNKYLELKKQMGGVPHFCQPNELMTLPAEDCINNTFVTGSCAQPAFKDGLADITSVQKDEYLQIFNLIKEKGSIKYLNIILGATDNFKSEFDNSIESLSLCITPMAIFDDFNTLMTNIRTNIIGKTIEP